jgi:hypothetical protein
MRSFVVPIVIGMLAYAAPAAAQSKTDKATSVGAITTQDTEAEMNSYTNNAHSEMRMWEQKLHDFNARVKTSDTEAETAASGSLDSAWTEMTTAWNQLVKVALNEGTDGVTDWDSAKVSFQVASQKLSVAWKNVNPEDK